MIQRHHSALWTLVLAIVFPSVVMGQTETVEHPPFQSEKQQRQSLESFKKINDHPLFEMTYYGDYKADNPLQVSADDQLRKTRWGCSIFVSFGLDGEANYGRNFDWYHNPALILHTNPSDGYASISLVDISYLGFKKQDKKYDRVEERQALLRAPLLPFDGMNEHGLTVGMAAVGDTQLPQDKKKVTVGGLQIIRLILDKTKTVDEALALFQKYNIMMRGGPNIHYLIADADGRSALIELKDNKIYIHHNKTNWQSATNFYITGEKTPLKRCWRFAKINKEMKLRKGRLNTDQTFDLLQAISQESTQWSIVYDLQNRSAKIATGRNFDKRYLIEMK